MLMLFMSPGWIETHRRRTSGDICDGVSDKAQLSRKSTLDVANSIRWSRSPRLEKKWTIDKHAGLGIHLCFLTVDAM